MAYAPTDFAPDFQVSPSRGDRTIGRDVVAKYRRAVSARDRLQDAQRLSDGDDVFGSLTCRRERAGIEQRLNALLEIRVERHRAA